MRIKRFPPIWPNRIDRYIIGEVIGPFLGGVIFFTFLFLMFRALNLAELFIVHGASGVILLKMTLLLILQFLPMVLPVAFLIAVLMAFGRLSADSEIVALKASGVSLVRLSVPVTLVALPIVFLSLALNMEWTPWGDRTARNLLAKIGNTKVVSSIKEGTFTSGFFDLLIFAEKVDSRTNRMKRVFIYDEREPKNPLTVVARTGEIVPVKTESEFASAAVLKLYNGSIHRNDTATGAYQKIDFGEYRLYLKIDEGGGNAFSKPQMIPYDDLKRQIRETPVTTWQGRELRGELWRRYAIALAPLIFVYLGMGFGTVRTRAVRAGAVLVAMVTLVVYWTALTVALMINFRGDLPSYLAMQIPNFVTLLAGLYAFHRARW